VALAWSLVWARRTLKLEAKLLLLTPLFLLGPFVFYNSISYYPRHILVAYVVMGVALMWLGGGAAERRETSAARANRLAPRRAAFERRRGSEDTG
jgi:hypothetical protein